VSRPISAIAVVLPARDEAQLLPAALAALETARARFAQTNPSVPVSITVVLDRTTDNSRELLSHYPGVRTVSVAAGRVGTARNAGIGAAWQVANAHASRLWIANTDADSEVPSHWIQRQFDLAAEGAQVVVGTVEPRSTDLSTAALRHWFSAHQLREEHPHVHGANLGFRADVFAGLGGFRDQGLHEDRDFVAQARARGYAVVATDSCRVRTSGRLQGRTKGGFASFLARLGQEAESVLTPPSPGFPGVLPLLSAIEGPALGLPTREQPTGQTVTS
jgi:glycosyltransferase involved in cell wall biosynthesis